MTKAGIFLNLNESTYKYKIYDLKFYFSSMFYMEKFIKNVEKYVETENMKLSNRTNLVINFNKFFAISFYQKIEKRGFKVIDLTKNKEIKRYTRYREEILI